MTRASTVSTQWRRVKSVPCPESHSGFLAGRDRSGLLILSPTPGPWQLVLSYILHVGDQRLNAFISP